MTFRVSGAHQQLRYNSCSLYRRYLRDKVSARVRAGVDEFGRLRTRPRLSRNYLLKLTSVHRHHQEKSLVADTADKTLNHSVFKVYGRCTYP